MSGREWATAKITRAGDSLTDGPLRAKGEILPLEKPVEKALSGRPLGLGQGFPLIYGEDK